MQLAKNQAISGESHRSISQKLALQEEGSEVLKAHPKTANGDWSVLVKDANIPVQGEGEEVLLRDVFKDLADRGKLVGYDATAKSPSNILGGRLADSERAVKPKIFAQDKTIYGAMRKLVSDSEYLRLTKNKATAHVLVDSGVNYESQLDELVKLHPDVDVVAVRRPLSNAPREDFPEYVFYEVSRSSDGKISYKTLEVANGEKEWGEMLQKYIRAENARHTLIAYEGIDRAADLAVTQNSRNIAPWVGWINEQTDAESLAQLIKRNRVLAIVDVPIDQIGSHTFTEVELLDLKNLGWTVDDVRRAYGDGYFLGMSGKNSTLTADNIVTHAEAVLGERMALDRFEQALTDANKASVGFLKRVRQEIVLEGASAENLAQVDNLLANAKRVELAYSNEIQTRPLSQAEIPNEVYLRTQRAYEQIKTNIELLKNTKVLSAEQASDLSRLYKTDMPFISREEFNATFALSKNVYEGESLSPTGIAQRFAVQDVPQSVPKLAFHTSSTEALNVASVTNQTVAPIAVNRTVQSVPVVGNIAKDLAASWNILTNAGNPGVRTTIQLRSSSVPINLAVAVNNILAARPSNIVLPQAPVGVLQNQQLKISWFDRNVGGVSDFDPAILFGANEVVNDFENNFKNNPNFFGRPLTAAQRHKLTVAVVTDYLNRSGVSNPVQNANWAVNYFGKTNPESQVLKKGGWVDQITTSLDSNLDKSLYDSYRSKFQNYIDPVPLNARGEFVVKLGDRLVFSYDLNGSDQKPKSQVVKKNQLVRWSKGNLGNRSGQNLPAAGLEIPVGATVTLFDNGNPISTPMPIAQVQRVAPVGAAPVAVSSGVRSIPKVEETTLPNTTSNTNNSAQAQFDRVYQNADRSPVINKWVNNVRTDGNLKSLYGSSGVDGVNMGLAGFALGILDEDRLTPLERTVAYVKVLEEAQKIYGIKPTYEIFGITDVSGKTSFAFGAGDSLFTFNDDGTRNLVPKSRVFGLTSPLTIPTKTSPIQNVLRGAGRGALAAVNTVGNLIVQGIGWLSPTSESGQTAPLEIAANRVINEVDHRIIQARTNINNLFTNFIKRPNTTFHPGRIFVRALLTTSAFGTLITSIAPEPVQNAAIAVANAFPTNPIVREIARVTDVASNFEVTVSPTAITATAVPTRTETPAPPTRTPIQVQTPTTPSEEASLTKSNDVIGKNAHLAELLKTGAIDAYGFEYPDGDRNIQVHYIEVNQLAGSTTTELKFEDAIAKLAGFREIHFFRDKNGNLLPVSVSTLTSPTCWIDAISIAVTKLTHKSGDAFELINPLLVLENSDLTTAQLDAQIQKDRAERQVQKRPVLSEESAIEEAINKLLQTSARSATNAYLDGLGLQFNDIGDFTPLQNADSAEFYRNKLLEFQRTYGADSVILLYLRSGINTIHTFTIEDVYKDQADEWRVRLLDGTGGKFTQLKFYNGEIRSEVDGSGSIALKNIAKYGPGFSAISRKPAETKVTQAPVQEIPAGVKTSTERVDNVANEQSGAVQNSVQVGGENGGGGSKDIILGFGPVFDWGKIGFGVQVLREDLGKVGGGAKVWVQDRIGDIFERIGVGLAPAGVGGVQRGLVTEIDPSNVGSTVVLANHADIGKFIDPPLQNAVRIFWDRNIETVASFANRETLGNTAYIDVTYDELTPENVLIAQKLGGNVLRHNVNGSQYRVLRFDFPVTETTSVAEVATHMEQIANQFKQQPFNWKIGDYQPKTYEQAYREFVGADPNGAPNYEIFAKETGLYFDSETKLFFISPEIAEKYKAGNLSSLQNLQNAGGEEGEIFEISEDLATRGVLDSDAKIPAELLAELPKDSEYGSYFRSGTARFISRDEYLKAENLFSESIDKAIEAGVQLDKNQLLFDARKAYSEGRMLLQNGTLAGRVFGFSPFDSGAVSFENEGIVLLGSNYDAQTLVHELIHFVSQRKPDAETYSEHQLLEGATDLALLGDFPGTFGNDFADTIYFRTKTPYSRELLVVRKLTELLNANNEDGKQIMLRFGWTGDINELYKHILKEEVADIVDAPVFGQSFLKPVVDQIIERFGIGGLGIVGNRLESVKFPGADFGPLTRFETNYLLATPEVTADYLFGGRSTEISKAMRPLIEDENDLIRERALEIVSFIDNEGSRPDGIYVHFVTSGDPSLLSLGQNDLPPENLPPPTAGEELEKGRKRKDGEGEEDDEVDDLTAREVPSSKRLSTLAERSGGWALTSEGRKAAALELETLISGTDGSIDQIRDAANLRIDDLLENARNGQGEIGYALAIGKSLRNRISRLEKTRALEQMQVDEQELILFYRAVSDKTIKGGSVEETSQDSEVREFLADAYSDLQRAAFTGAKKAGLPISQAPVIFYQMRTETFEDLTEELGNMSREFFAAGESEFGTAGALDGLLNNILIFGHNDGKFSPRENILARWVREIAQHTNVSQDVASIRADDIIALVKDVSKESRFVKVLKGLVNPVRRVAIAAYVFTALMGFVGSGRAYSPDVQALRESPVAADFGETKLPAREHMQASGLTSGVHLESPVLKAVSFAEVGFDASEVPLWEAYSLPSQDFDKAQQAPLIKVQTTEASGAEERTADQVLEFLPGIEVSRKTDEVSLSLGFKYTDEWWDQQTTHVYKSIGGEQVDMFFTPDSQVPIKAVVTLTKLVRVVSPSGEKVYTVLEKWGQIPNPEKPGQTLFVPLFESRANVQGELTIINLTAPIENKFNQVDPKTGKYIFSVGATAGYWGGNPDDGQRSGKLGNLQREAELLDGKVVPANTTVAFTELTGPISEENGFVKGKAYSGQELVEATGGGGCAGNTAVTRAALQALVHLPKSELQTKLNLWNEHVRAHAKMSYTATENSSELTMQGIPANQFVDGALWDTGNLKLNSEAQITNPTDVSLTIRAELKVVEDPNADMPPASMEVYLESDGPLDPKLRTDIVGPFVSGTVEAPRYTSFVLNQKGDGVKVTLSWEAGEEVHGTQKFEIVTGRTDLLTKKTPQTPVVETKINTSKVERAAGVLKEGQVEKQEIIKTAGESFRAPEFIAPVPGDQLWGEGYGFEQQTSEISTGNGLPLLHAGIDYDTVHGEGTPTIAITNEKVVEIGYNEFFGNYTISHVKDDIYALRGHLKAFSPNLQAFYDEKFGQGNQTSGFLDLDAEGKAIDFKQKDMIGEIGTTGASEIPHLHFVLIRSLGEEHPHVTDYYNRTSAQTSWVDPRKIFNADYLEDEKLKVEKPVETATGEETAASN